MSDHPDIAFESDCELLNAAWSLDSGRTVDFRITGHAYDRLHPFKRFTQRRNGRVGTRFTATIAHKRSDGNVELMYHSDAMLRSWGDSSSTGQQFSLWLDDEADRHPFAGYSRRNRQDPGDLFYVVLVELRDDETPVDQTKREPSPSAPKPRAPRKPSAAAHLIVTSPMFVRYLTETKPGIVQKWTAELARKYVKQMLGIESLSMLDRNHAIAERFDREVRRAFNRWSSQEP